MKHLFFAYILVLLLASCNNQHRDAEKLAGQIESTSKELRPGTMATEENGWTLKAK